MNTGAMIERGVIIRAEDGRYCIRSFCRDGVVTPMIGAMGDHTYQEGDRVYFFMFCDGNGLILAEMT